MGDESAGRDEFQQLSDRLAEIMKRLETETRESAEIYGRASMALDRAGVPCEPEPDNKDPLDQLAARIRWLGRQRPVTGGAHG